MERPGGVGQDCVLTYFVCPGNKSSLFPPRLRRNVASTSPKMQDHANSHVNHFISGLSTGPEKQNQRLTSGLSVGHQQDEKCPFLWLPNCGPTPFCPSKPFSCKACPEIRPLCTCLKRRAKNALRAGYEPWMNCWSNAAFVPPWIFIKESDCSCVRRVVQDIQQAGRVGAPCCTAWLGRAALCANAAVRP